MGQSTISARIDSKDKSDFDKFCNNVGLSASTAINLFVKAVLRENRIPFDIVQSPDPFYSDSNQSYVLKSVQELREGKGQVHELIEEDIHEWNNMVWWCLARLFILHTAKVIIMINNKEVLKNDRKRTSRSNNKRIC